MDASTIASTHATGIDGGEGNNEILNAGPVLVRASNAIEAGERQMHADDAKLNRLLQLYSGNFG